MLTPKDLRTYQVRAAKFMIANPIGAMLIDMGLGKTIIALSAIKVLLKRDKIERALVIAPARVIKNVWRQEGAQWQHTQQLTFSLVHGSARQRIKALNTYADIYLISPDNVHWLIDIFRRRSVWPFDTLVIDESTKFKDKRTRRWKKLVQRINAFERRYIMTGTPAPDTLRQLWAQFYIADEGERLGVSYERFTQALFIQKDYKGYKFEPRPGTMRKISNRIGDISVRLDAEDWLKLPKLIQNAIPVELPDKAMALYRKLEKQMFLRLKETRIDAFNAAALSQKCHQLANGAVYGEDLIYGKRTVEWVHTAKLDALQELLEETSDNVLVAYWFKHDLARLQLAYPKAPCIDSDDVIARWNKKRYKVAFIHPASAGHGLNLQFGGHTLAFFSLCWSGEKHDQIIQRIGPARQVNMGIEAVMIHYLIAKGTTDELIMSTQDYKHKGQRSLLAAVKDYAKRRGYALR